MSTSIQHHSAQSLSLAARLFGAVLHALRATLALARAIGHRGDVRLMLEMDERALKDIGLTRNDVLGALSHPLSQDPSKILLVRSVERRARSRALGRIALRQAQGVRPLVRT